MIALTFFKKALTALAAAIAGGIYCFTESKRLVTTDYTVQCDGLPQAFSEKKILHLSDLHKRTFGDDYETLLDACKAAAPDYIFFTGDLYSRSEPELAPKALLMRRLSEIAPVYYILGNHEAEHPDKAQQLIQSIESENIHVLRNEMSRICIGGDIINVYGAEIALKYYKNTDGSYSALPELIAENIEAMLGKADGEHFNILLAHTPFPFEEYAKWGADLTLSGHCHGGVIRLPIIGGILSPERRFFPKYTKGLYKQNANGKCSQMVLSAGLGKFRLWNPAEIVTVTLKATERDD